jgi:hypothetical protein
MSYKKRFKEVILSSIENGEQVIFIPNDYNNYFIHDLIDRISVPISKNEFIHTPSVSNCKFCPAINICKFAKKR